MDTRTPLRIAGLLALALGGCSVDDGADAHAAVRQAFRTVTQLIRVAVPAPPPAGSITMGVRG